MGQSLVQNYIHIVFSTKYREPLIISSVEKELHNYLGGICNNLECQKFCIDENWRAFNYKITGTQIKNEIPYFIYTSQYQSPLL